MSWVIKMDNDKNYEDDDGFIERDVVTGKKIRKMLNKKKLTPQEMDKIFGGELE